MKFIVLAACLALALGKSLPNQDDWIIKTITQYGYEAEQSVVTTEDGYILQLVRIPHGLTNKHTTQPRPAILLMHGFMSSAEDFIYGGPSQGLAFYLAEQGYDVYLGNTRGSLYGRQHTKLDPTKDAAFWRFCFQEIGTKDLPAIVDQVLSISGREQLSYVGHMEGATAFYVLASERVEYNEKIEKMVALGPLAFMGKSTNSVLKQVVNHKSQPWVMKNIGLSTFKPSTEVLEEVQNKCTNLYPEQPICQNMYMLMVGYNSLNLNQTTINQVLTRAPTGTGSVRQVLHMAQLLETGRFESFALDTIKSGERHEYDLTKVSAPVAIFYAPEDKLAHVDDVKILIEKLPNVYSQQLIQHTTNNLDLLYSKNVVTIYNQVLQVLKEQPERRIYA